VDTALSLDVLANDLIPAGGVTISLPLSVTSAQGFAISVVNNEVLYTPSNGYNGSDTFSYSITDVNTVTSTAVVTIMVGTVPVPPVGSDKPLAVDDTMVSLSIASIGYNSTENSINVLGNDTPGSDGYINKGLTMINGTSSNASANSGAIRVERNGTLDTLDDVIMYSAPTNFSGVDTFKYTITDASGDA
ncbi:Ig-like domain-containing protein, partial [Polaribacter glomeratus]|uniref:Ig-like domain-containing protein n=1 Tax=Polaribacter glomeratus TaxID=102 RepID=UPI001478F925